MVRFPVAMVLNPDGTSNDEYGTTPNIWDRDPLFRVIQIINNREE
jgi:hypothetical protein